MGGLFKGKLGIHWATADNIRNLGGNEQPGKWLPGSWIERTVSIVAD
jgi:hypothetical protein